jgi:hypothetical protein
MDETSNFPIGVRAADQTVFSDLFNQNISPLKSDIRDQFPDEQRDFVSPIM